MRIRRLTTWTLLLLASPLTAQHPSPGALALTDVTLIDGTGAPPRPGMTILVEDGRIRDVFRSSERRPPAAASVLDLDGRWVVPGLINSHIHLMRLPPGREALEAELRRMLYGGVTTVREPGSRDPGHSAEVSRAVRAGELVGPDVHHAGDAVAGPYIPGGPFRQSSAARRVAHPTDAGAVVAEAVAGGATGIKVWMGVDADALRALTEEAHRQGLRTWSHLTVFPARPIEVVRAGVEVVSHLCGLPWQDADFDPSRNVPFVHTPRDRPVPRFDPERVEEDSPEMAALFREMVRRGTILDGTLSKRTFQNSERLSAEDGCTPEFKARMARAARRAGVTLAAGTDYWAPPGEPFPTLLRELEALVDEEVLTPLETITAATLTGARVLGIEDTHGSVEPGKVADLVVLRADPSRDIRALREIELVIKQGIRYPREEYDRQRRAAGRPTTPTNRAARPLNRPGRDGRATPPSHPPGS